MKNATGVLVTFARFGFLVGCVCAASTSAAWAHMSDSFLKIPGAVGTWLEGPHRRWIRVEASYWGTGLDKRLLTRNLSNDDRMVFSAPGAAKPGSAGSLAISLNKHDPAVHVLMSICTERRSIAALAYDESSDGTRLALELAPRPANIPRYWQYRLKD